MKVLLIACDLKSKGKIYKPLFDAIKSETGYWWHYANIWLVYTKASPEDLAGKLRQFMDEKTDYLFVVELKKSYQGWLPQEAWKWLNEKTF